VRFISTRFLLVYTFALVEDDLLMGDHQYLLVLVCFERRPSMTRKILSATSAAWPSLPVLANI